MNTRTIKKLLSLCVFAVVVGAATPVSAEIRVDVNWHGKKNPTFDEKHIKPGDSVEQEITVTNTGDEVQDLYLKIEKVKNRSFADQFKVYLIDKNSKKYYLGGIGERFTLQDLEKKGSVFIERLDPGEKGRYILKLQFDESAGNEFQRQKLSFDTKFGFKGKPVSPNAPLPLRLTRGGGGERGSSQEVQGVEVNGKGSSERKEEAATGEVQGAAEVQCENAWAWWVWMLLLIALFGLQVAFNILLHGRTSLVASVLLFIGALVVWYLFDVCRDYWWFVVGALLITLGNIFLQRMKKEAQEGE